MLLADAADRRLTRQTRAELNELARAAKRMGFVNMARAMLAAV
jgi:hypothetical protein